MNHTPIAAVATIAPAMVHFGGGWFRMGSRDGAPAEQPVHDRWVAPFALDSHLVTNREFAEFVAATGYSTTAEQAGSAWGFDGARFGEIAGLHWRHYATALRARHPVVLVSWHDATAYAAWVGKRLPSEAEWEHVARLALSDDHTDAAATRDPLAYCGAGRAWGAGPGTSIVGSRPARAGVYDLVGNVWQWCADAYAADAYRHYVAGTDAAGAADHELRARRGGAWNVQQAFRLRASNRGAYRANRCAPNLGFRCARSTAP